MTGSLGLVALAISSVKLLRISWRLASALRSSALSASFCRRMSSARDFSREACSGACDASSRRRRTSASAAARRWAVAGSMTGSLGLDALATSSASLPRRVCIVSSASFNSAFRDSFCRRISSTFFVLRDDSCSLRSASWRRRRTSASALLSCEELGGSVFGVNVGMGGGLEVSASLTGCFNPPSSSATALRFLASWRSAFWLTRDKASLVFSLRFPTISGFHSG